MTQDQFFLYGTSAVVFHQDYQGGLAAYVLRQGERLFVMDNRLLSAIDYDQHDYATALSRDEFLRLVRTMHIDPRDSILYTIQQASLGIIANGVPTYRTGESEKPQKITELTKKLPYRVMQGQGLLQKSIIYPSAQLLKGR